MAFLISLLISCLTIFFFWSVRRRNAAQGTPPATAAGSSFYPKAEQLTAPKTVSETAPKTSTSPCCCLPSDTTDCCRGAPLVSSGNRGASPKKRLRIVYATQTSNALNLAHKLFNKLSAMPGFEEVFKPIQILDVKHCNVDSLQKDADITVFLLATYTGGAAPESSQLFASMLQDLSQDWRFPRDHLAGVKFALFGLGDISYGDELFCKFPKDAATWIRSIGGKFMLAPVFATEHRLQSLFQIFAANLMKHLNKQWLSKEKTDKKRGALKGKEDVLGDVALVGEESCDGSGDASSEADSEGSAAEDDFEDMVPGAAPQRELLYPRLQKNLQKQGYHIVGSHSGVKLCRWTKSMLRGRGGCYKHTFYNIASYQCMEMTPSLACANKCVFCWRHHTNPVARGFQWKHDAPEFLIEKATEGHRQMLKQMRGVPGVKPERLEEAMTIRHCALSLVGEPIMYPEINRFVELLHEKHISSFMVTNAQFPEQLRDLSPVTQLYLSIDAPTRNELKAIDRPLFEDFWERCLSCVHELSRKAQRTVFRLTLVRGYNMDHIKNYAALVRHAMPDFIEVKGVTYCGAVGSSGLRMAQNVPFHEEVINFCEQLCEAIRTPDANVDCSISENISVEMQQRRQQRHGDIFEYSVACEHEHSCCVLIAHHKFRIGGKWHTWIDYEKFQSLVQQGSTEFTALDYALPTPDWAVYKSAEKGFDPEEVRVRKGMTSRKEQAAIRIGKAEEAGIVA